MKLRCLFGKHKYITVIDAIILENGFMWGGCFSFGATVEKSHKQCKFCEKHEPEKRPVRTGDFRGGQVHPRKYVEPQVSPLPPVRPHSDILRPRTPRPSYKGKLYGQTDPSKEWFWNGQVWIRKPIEPIPWDKKY